MHQDEGEERMYYKDILENIHWYNAKKGKKYLRWNTIVLVTFDINNHFHGTKIVVSETNQTNNVMECTKETIEIAIKKHHISETKTDYHSAIFNPNIGNHFINNNVRKNVQDHVRKNQELTNMVHGTKLGNT